MRWLIAGLLVVTSSYTYADGALYGELQVGAGYVNHSNLDFYPSIGTVTLGAFVLPGIGFEVFADSGLAEGSEAGFEMSLEHAQGVAARFQSPPVKGLQGFVVLGLVDYTLEQRSDLIGTATGRTISEDFRGARVSIGMMQRLKRFPYLQVTAEYRHYNADEPIRLDGIVFGLRVNAP